MNSTASAVQLGTFSSDPVGHDPIGRGSNDDPSLQKGIASLVLKADRPIDDATVLVIDDEPVNIKVVSKYLKTAGCQNVSGTSDPCEALRMIRMALPDVVILDIMMPKVNGLEILAGMRQEAMLRHVPVLILTASTDPQTKLSALNLGATDFLSKPVDPNELVVRVRNAFTLKAHHDHMAEYSTRLEHEVRVRTQELRESRQEVIHVLACAAEYRDHETGNHVIRVGRYAGILARHLNLDAEFVDMIQQAAVLHDVGKIGITDAILLKPGRLTPSEMEIMKNHAEYDMNILRGVPSAESTKPVCKSSFRRQMNSPLLRMAATISISHHEKWDGSGYPLGLSGESIPIEGRITAVADVFDALSSKRPYKKAMPLEECCDIVEKGRGNHFDPAVLDAFQAGLKEIINVMEVYADEDE